MSRTGGKRRSVYALRNSKSLANCSRTGRLSASSLISKLCRDSNAVTRRSFRFRKPTAKDQKRERQQPKASEMKSAPPRVIVQQILQVLSGRNSVAWQTEQLALDAEPFKLSLEVVKPFSCFRVQLLRLDKHGGSVGANSRGNCGEVEEILFMQFSRLHFTKQEFAVSHTQHVHLAL